MNLHAANDAPGLDDALLITPAAAAAFGRFGTGFCGSRLSRVSVPNADDADADADDDEEDDDDDALVIGVSTGARGDEGGDFLDCDCEGDDESGALACASREIRDATPPRDAAMIGDDGVGGEFETDDDDDTSERLFADDDSIPPDGDGELPEFESDDDDDSFSSVVAVALLPPPPPTPLSPLRVDDELLSSSFVALGLSLLFLVDRLLPLLPLTSGGVSGVSAGAELSPAMLDDESSGVSLLFWPDVR